MARRSATATATAPATEGNDTITATLDATAEATQLAADATEGHEFDVASLAASSVETDEMEKATRTRERKPNPFDAILAASNENGKAYVIPSVPAAKVDDVKKILRNAATFLKIGVKTVTRFNDDGTVKVTYKATPKRAYKPRKSDAGE